MNFKRHDLNRKEETRLSLLPVPCLHHADQPFPFPSVCFLGLDRFLSVDWIGLCHPEETAVSGIS
jgi:hypothetical protein